MNSHGADCGQTDTFENITFWLACVLLMVKTNGNKLSFEARQFEELMSNTAKPEVHVCFLEVIHNASRDLKVLSDIEYKKAWVTIYCLTFILVLLFVYQ